MTAPTNRQGLILPFNIEPAAYEAMYASEPPKNLTMVLSLLFHSCGGGCGDSWGPAPWLEDDPVEMLAKRAKTCIANSPFPKMKCEIVIGEEDEFSTHITDVIELEQPQDGWVTHGYYPQVHFRDDSVSDLIESEVPFHTAMTVDDAMYARSRSIDPKLHLPIAAPREKEVAFRLIVGDTYRVHLGVWCEALRPLRNEILVKTHATVINEEDDDPRKPNKEWKKFCDAGMVHFLDYVKLLHA
jgi:hypothetical protein